MPTLTPRSVEPRAWRRWIREGLLLTYRQAPWFGGIAVMVLGIPYLLSDLATQQLAIVKSSLSGNSKERTSTISRGKKTRHRSLQKNDRFFIIQLSPVGD